MPPPSWSSDPSPMPKPLPRPRPRPRPRPWPWTWTWPPSPLPPPLAGLTRGDGGGCVDAAVSTLLSAGLSRGWGWG